MQKLFERNKNQAADFSPWNVDAEIVITPAPYIKYEQVRLDDNSRTYLEGAVLSEHVPITWIKPAPYQISFEMVIGTESRVVNFQAANKQFSVLVISLVYDKSDQRRSIYDSYNTELASTKIKSIKLENAVCLKAKNLTPVMHMINICSICNLLHGTAKNQVYCHCQTTRIIQYIKSWQN